MCYTNLICCTSLSLSPPLLPHPASFRIWKLECTRLLVVFTYLTHEYGLLIKVVVFVCMGLLLIMFVLDCVISDLITIIVVMGVNLFTTVVWVIIN